MTTASLDPHAAWYLSRGSGFVALGLLTLSVMFGLLFSAKTRYPTGGWTLAVHRHVSMLALTTTATHVLVLLFDDWMKPSVAELLVPGKAQWNPLATAVGQVALYLMLVVQLSGYVKGRVPVKLWRAVHLLSIPAWIAALWHFFAGGSDARTPAGYVTAAVCVLLVLCAAAWRTGAAAGRAGRRPRPAASTAAVATVAAPTVHEPVQPHHVPGPLAAAGADAPGEDPELAARVAALKARRSR